MRKIEENKKLKKSSENEKINLKVKVKVSLLLIIVSGILFGMGKVIPGFSDWYYRYIYFILQNTVCRLFSLFPFSVYEFIILGFTVYLFYRFITYIIILTKGRIKIKDIIKNSAASSLLYVSIFIFLNVVGQSVNCFKSSFITLTGIEIQDVNEEKLIEVCEVIRDKLNILDGKINKDEDGLFILDGDTDKKGIEIMTKLSQKYPCLKGFYPNPKHYIFSEIMSYQLLQGETTFTIEANYNKDMAESNIPSTICHELSHIQGFNNENEANFISFLACINSHDYEYEYSGYLMAYIYCINDLYSVNKEAFNEVNNGLSENVKNEIRSDSMFWSKYRGGISKLYTKVYDILLKAGGQEEGIKSYNGVVKLIVSSYKNEWR